MIRLLLRALPLVLYLAALAWAVHFCLAHPHDAFRGLPLVVLGLPWSLLILPLSLAATPSGDLAGLVLIGAACFVNGLLLLILATRLGRRKSSR